MKTRTWIFIGILVILLSACGTKPTPSPYQPYLDAVIEITKESQPYSDELIALGKRNAYPSEYHPLLVRWAATAAKYSKVKVPDRFKMAHKYLNAYSLDIANALKDLDANDMASFVLDMRLAEGDFHLYILDRDAVLAAEQR